MLYRVSKKNKVFNEPLNNSHSVNFQIIFVFGCKNSNLNFDLYILHFRSLLVEISHQGLNPKLQFKNLRKRTKKGYQFQGISEKYSARNRYSFEYYGVFVLVFVQKTRQTIRITSFLAIGGFFMEEGQQKTPM